MLLWLMFFPCLSPDRRLSSTLVCSSAGQPQENAPCASSLRPLEGGFPQPLATPLPHLVISSPKDSSSPAGEMSAGPSADQAEAPWAGSQDDTDGPEYLAIGNLGRHSRACSSQSGSSTATTNSVESSTSNLFSSSSSQKRGSVSSLGEQGTSGDSGSGRATGSLLRRSSFSEGQTSAPQRMLKGGHVRSHSDTNVAFGKSHGKADVGATWTSAFLCCAERCCDGLWIQLPVLPPLGAPALYWGLRPPCGAASLHRALGT